MEDKSTFIDFDLTISEKIKSILKVTYNWTYFLSIIGFVGTFLLVVLGALFGVIMRSMPVNPYENVELKVNYFGLIYIVIAVIYFIPILYLFKFSKKLKSALNSNNNDDLISAFENLKSHYKYLGLLSIILISIFILLFLLGGLGIFF